MIRFPVPALNLLIPLVTVVGAFYSDQKSSHPKMAHLTGVDGKLLVVKPQDVYVIHPSSLRVRDRQCTELRIVGMDSPRQVLETPEQVAWRLGCRWVSLHVMGSWLGLGSGPVGVLVAPDHVRMVEPSGYRLSTQTQPLSNVMMAQGYQLQVIEDVREISRRLGM